MALMKNCDLLIVGGGMVGLALATALSASEYKITIVEAYPPTQSSISDDEISNRVSALNLSSQVMLQQLGVWQELQKLRHCFYNKMEIWEKDSFAHIELDSQPLGLTQLGCIIENKLIRQALWNKVSTQSNVEIIHAKPQNIDINERCALLTLDNQEVIMAQLIVAADGANSWVRQQCDIPIIFRDYGHNALVCNVETDEAHQHCARQIFEKDAILAFLPMQQSNLCSIVWSQPPQQAEAMLALSDEEFNKAVNVAFDNRLGLCKVQGPRQTIPLTARYARDFVKNRVALIGDAAHTIHPLAGLGVNLGFMDAIALAETIQTMELTHTSDIGELRHLRKFSQWRKNEAIKMLIAMQGFKSLFEGDNPLKKLIRGAGMSLTNQLPFVKEQFIRQALGLEGDLPKMIKEAKLDNIELAELN